MIQLRKAAEWGHFDHGWLDTDHTFSFGDYSDSDHLVADENAISVQAAVPSEVLLFDLA